MINPLINQELYIYDCYVVDITDGHYNTKTSIETCPTKNQCYCSQQFASSDKFKTHEKQHARQAWARFECDKKSKGNDKCAVYKHYRTQHKRRHLHQCTFDTHSVDGHPFGNDEQYMVWWHMQDEHGLHSPLGCPKCEGTFYSKQSQHKHIPTCLGKKHKFGPKQTPCAEKKFRCDECPKPQRLHSCSTRKYTKALQRSVCSLCGKALSLTTALHRHEKIHEDN